MATFRVGDYEWEEEKARANLQKHGVSFEEAMSVFLDEHGLTLQDVADPGRLILIGESRIGGIVLVVFTEVAPSGNLRIISARRATKRERRAYEED